MFAVHSVVLVYVQVHVYCIHIRTVDDCAAQMWNLQTQRKVLFFLSLTLSMILCIAIQQSSRFIIIIIWLQGRTHRSTATKCGNKRSKNQKKIVTNLIGVVHRNQTKRQRVKKKKNRMKWERMKDEVACFNGINSKTESNARQQRCYRPENNSEDFNRRWRIDVDVEQSNVLSAIKNSERQKSNHCEDPVCSSFVPSFIISPTANMAKCFCLYSNITKLSDVERWWQKRK